MCPLIVYFSGKTGNTKRFVERIGDRAVSIDSNLIVCEPYVLFTSTYADAKGRNPVPKTVIKFLNNPANRENLIGVVCSGNTNFGEFFGIAADVISSKCEVPTLLKFDLSGTQEDVNLYRKALREVL